MPRQKRRVCHPRLLCRAGISPEPNTGAEATDRREAALRIRAVCIGEETAAEARRVGFDVAVTSARQAVGAVADADAGYLRPQEVAS